MKLRNIVIYIVLFTLAITILFGFGTYHIEKYTNLTITKGDDPDYAYSYLTLDDSAIKFEDDLKYFNEKISEKLILLPQNIIDSLYKTEKLSKVKIEKPKSTIKEIDHGKKVYTINEIKSIKERLIWVHSEINKDKLFRFNRLYWIVEIILLSIFGFIIGLNINEIDKQRLLTFALIITISIILIPFIVQIVLVQSINRFLFMLFGIQIAILIYFIKFYKGNKQQVTQV